MIQEICGQRINKSQYKIKYIENQKTDIYCKLNLTIQRILGLIENERNSNES